MGEGRVAAGGDALEPIGQAAGNRAGCSLSDARFVNLPHRKDGFGSGGQEHLFGGEQVRNSQVPLGAGNAQGGAQLDDAGAGDAEQHVLVPRRRQGAVDDGEEVGGGRFRHGAGGVEQQDVVEPVPPRPPLGEGRAGVVGGHLGLGRHDVLAPVADLALHLELQRLRRMGLAGVAGDDVRLVVVGRNEHGHPGVLGHQLHLDGGDQGADLQEAGAGIAPHRLHAGALQFVLAAADGNAHDAAGLQQSGDVLRQPHEGRPLGGGVDAHEIEGEGAPLQALRKHMHIGVRPEHELPVTPDQAVLGFHQLPTKRCLASRPHPRRRPPMATQLIEKKRHFWLETGGLAQCTGQD